ncbi:MAG: ATP-dependent protease ATPase subunit HslU [Deltaproteobacteria bacterium]|nr:ATP-dependent protease ATPase subunit HslU [Deltaproteobacteria bacterium]MCW5808443.1 ATP-dependent protease ATPase subunit HslU [Deltaproteobacteria bacterium]
MAHRPRAAPARGDARRGRRRGDVPPVGLRRRDRARRRHRRDRLRRPVRARGGPRPDLADRALAARDRRGRDEDRRRHLHLHELSPHDRGAVVTDPHNGLALTPARIVEELDRYVVGQREAKRAVAVALRNRWRRQQVEGDLRDEIAPKNIIMIGPTGVGKTEIARRLARLAKAPFLKVEASKFTEVGYVGRDVDSIVRDLAEVAVKLVRDEEAQKVRPRAKDAAEERLLDLLLPRSGRSFTDRPGEPTSPATGDATREKLRAMLRDGRLDDRDVEVELADDANPLISVLGGQPGIDESALSGLRDMFGALGKKTRRQKLKVPQAWRALTEQEVDKLIDHDAATREAVHRAENAGIVFIDEIDKIATSRDRHGADVSREGVQRDLLPIVEGSTVTTKYGPIKTDHVLFIAAGAFHMSKPSDLIPEMQGRFPIRVELAPLVAEDFVRILTEPQNALTRQYAALLATEGVTIEWADDAIVELARIAADVNKRTHDIGARRLHTVLERLLDDLLYNAPDIGKQTIPITPAYVRERLGALVADEDLARYIL